METSLNVKLNSAPTQRLQTKTEPNQTSKVDSIVIPQKMTSDTVEISEIEKIKRPWWKIIAIGTFALSCIFVGIKSYKKAKEAQIKQEKEDFTPIKKTENEVVVDEINEVIDPPEKQPDLIEKTEIKPIQIEEEKKIEITPPREKKKIVKVVPKGAKGKNLIREFLEKKLAISPNQIDDEITTIIRNAGINLEKEEIRLLPKRISDSILEKAERSKKFEDKERLFLKALDFIPKPNENFNATPEEIEEGITEFVRKAIYDFTNKISKEQGNKLTTEIENSFKNGLTYKNVQKLLGLDMDYETYITISKNMEGDSLSLSFLQYINENLDDMDKKLNAKNTLAQILSSSESLIAKIKNAVVEAKLKDIIKYCQHFLKK